MSFVMLLSFINPFNSTQVVAMAVDAVVDMVEDVEVADTEEDAAETMEEADMVVVDTEVEVMVAEATEVDR